MSLLMSVMLQGLWEKLVKEHLNFLVWKAKLISLVQLLERQWEEHQEDL